MPLHYTPKVLSQGDHEAQQGAAALIRRSM